MMNDNNISVHEKLVVAAMAAVMVFIFLKVLFL
jgi:hypothetical protein